MLDVTEEGINYLEYKAKFNSIKDKEETISGYIYNLSLFELRKVFDMTGKDLFRKNVREGLETNTIGKKIKEDFKDYMRIYLYSNLDKKLKKDESEYREAFLKDFYTQFFITDEKLKTRIPEKFWFYHNGVTIFSFDSKEYARTGSTIEINPKKVSVINGAQTLTNFYLGLEEISFEVKELSSDVGSDSFKEGMDNLLEKLLKEVEKNIILKTIFIHGSEENVWPITFGLNTQIPIEETGILANSVEVIKINEILSKINLKILRDGESASVGNGISVRDFAKLFLIIEEEPGRSKNLNIKYIEKEIKNAYDKILKNEEKYLRSFEKIEVIEDWWMKKRTLKNEKKYIELENYGKNYFESFILINTEEEIDIDFEIIEFYYDIFLRDFSKLKKETLDVSDFKTDKLFKMYKKELENKKRTQKLIELDRVPIDIDDMKDYILNNSENNYNTRSVIMKYLENNNIEFSQFRVISMVDNKPMEAYSFPNATFRELYYGKDYNNMTFKEYKESQFHSEINKVFPVFIIKWNDSNRNRINDIKFKEKFSFGKFDGAAKNTYDAAVRAFRIGDPLSLPKISDKLGFHVRPKAINKQDTFEFSNGQLLTKQSFWANRDTIVSIINEL